MRRAAYLRGAGRLSIANGRLLFVADGQHPLVEDLVRAAFSDQPRHALATLVGMLGSDVPPFVFAWAGEGLEGIVCGAIKARIDDGGTVTVDGASADPWADFDASCSSTLTCGSGQFEGALWVESGLVRASGFRWAIRHDQVPVPAPAQDVEAALEDVGQEMRDDEETPLDSSSRSDGLLGKRSAVLEALEAEFDATTDAIRFAEIRSDKLDIEPNRSLRRGGGDSAGPTVMHTATEAALDIDEDDETKHAADTTDDDDVTMDLGPGQVMLDSLHAERRMIPALVCLKCDSPNPPAEVRCRSCAALLSSENTELQEVPQPVLGVIHLSEGREELLDTDLVIGRNPASMPLDRYQRAVVHGAQDRSVSRRHIELKLDQWKVMVINLKHGARTIRQARDGSLAELVPGIPQRLWPGESVHYGGAWLRFEPEE